MSEKTVSPAIERPLSPHLQVYRPQLTTVLSIFHRITGAALAFGTAALVAWLWSAAYSAECFDSIHHFFMGTLGRLLLLGWTYAFFFHFCNGIRHLFWDLGRGFTLPVAYASGWTAVIASIVFTVITWLMAFQSLGGAQ